MPANETFRSSRPEVFCKKGVLGNFTKIHRKTRVSESLFNTVETFRSCRSEVFCKKGAKTLTNIYFAKIGNGI